jgi:hypothetical protein
MEIESLVTPRPLNDPFKWVPVASLIVATASFTFAVSVLYPWHIELSRQFLELKDSCRL